ncbi:hypothetical protein PMAYCL1PPCAC_17490, partial [Pristionchus mayeri]
QKFLGRYRGWRLACQPLIEQFNSYTWLTTSETIAKLGKEEYDEMLQKRREAAIEKRREDKEENEKKKEELIAKGIPAQFHPHVPL